ncbi:Sequestosome-1 [Orchesella cincta]|uniref:Sequestosome-1 n=1 Tax=Orchesella cincta TaxID=48709 RepID=A0A1D2MF20_ORCCI|nr:Sequestosome-1 [Orchesella cincta]
MKKHTHTICTFCKTNLPVCSKCGKGGNVPTLPEDNTLFDCVYKEKGCLERLKREEVFQHVKTCRYKSDSIQLCKLLGFAHCKYVHKLDAERSQIIRHFVEEHGSEVGRGKNGLRISLMGITKLSDSSENSIWRPVLYSFDNEEGENNAGPLFLITGKVDADTDCATWTCIKLWGKQVKANEEEENYDAEFVLENECKGCYKASWEFGGPSDQLPSVKWTIPVADAREEKCHLEASPILIPLRFVRKLFVINRTHVNMVVTIRNKKQAGKKTIKSRKEEFNQVLTVGVPLETGDKEKVEIKMKEKEKVVLANHIICDGCEQYPIIGTQYKCLQCPDFDLCEECMEKGVHSFHVFVVLANKTQNQIIRQRRSRSGLRQLKTAVNEGNLRKV